MERDRILVLSLVGRMVELGDVDFGASAPTDEYKGPFFEFCPCWSVGSLRIVLIFKVSLLGSMVRVDIEVCESNPVSIASESAGR